MAARKTSPGRRPLITNRHARKMLRDQVGIEMEPAYRSGKKKPARRKTNGSKPQRRRRGY